MTAHLLTRSDPCLYGRSNPFALISQLSGPWLLCGTRQSWLQTSVKRPLLRTLSSKCKIPCSGWLANWSDDPALCLDGSVFDWRNVKGCVRQPGCDCPRVRQWLGSGCGMVHILHLAMRSLRVFWGSFGNGNVPNRVPLSRMVGWEQRQMGGKIWLVWLGEEGSAFSPSYSAAYMRSGWWAAHPNSNTFSMLPPLDSHT